MPWWSPIRVLLARAGSAQLPRSDEVKLAWASWFRAPPDVLSSTALLWSCTPRAPVASLMDSVHLLLGLICLTHLDLAVRSTLPPQTLLSALTPFPLQQPPPIPSPPPQILQQPLPQWLLVLEIWDQAKG